MNKALSILVLFLLAMPVLAQEADEVEPSDAPVRAKVTGDVRTYGSPGGAAVGKLTAGADVMIIGTSEGWMRVRSEAGNAVGEGAQLDAEDRQTIRKLKVGSSTLGEGRLVAVTGFIVGKPHPNKGESVNCGLTAAPDNDIHISIVGDPEESEFDSIV